MAEAPIMSWFFLDKAYGFLVARMSLVFMFGTSISETAVSKIAFYSTIMDIN